MKSHILEDTDNWPATPVPPVPNTIVISLEVVVVAWVVTISVHNMLCGAISW